MINTTTKMIYCKDCKDDTRHRVMSDGRETYSDCINCELIQLQEREEKEIT